MEIPVPIPNTEVKRFCADGTAWEAVWESRTLPKNLIISLEMITFPGFFFGFFFAEEFIIIGYWD